MSTSQAFQAQALYERELLAKSNVVGVAVGFKETKGDTHGDLAVVVLVEQKKPLAALAAEDVVPPQIDGMKTDVYEVGYLRALQSPRDRFRPVIPNGVSIGHFKITAGTLGTIVKDKNTGERLILSNNHVLANSNDAQIGDDVLQPAAMDGGKQPDDVVAMLERYVPLRFIGDPVDVPVPPIIPTPSPTPNPPVDQPDPEPPLPLPPITNPTNPPMPPTPDPDAPAVPQPTNSGCIATIAGLINLLNGLVGSDQRLVVASQAQLAAASVPKMPAMPMATNAVASNLATIPANLVDCALAKPIDPTMFSDDIRGIGVVDESMVAKLGMRVRKSGRTTDYTEGNITLLNATVNVAYSTAKGPRTARFTGQVIAEGMSQGGDSGSLVVDVQENKAVGLLFAGSNIATIFTPIDVVLNALGVTL